MRRLQAFQLYACLIGRLREPAITSVIDDGRELVPVLAQRLGVTRAQLAALREAEPATAVRWDRHSPELAVRHLQAHAVPLHQWPGSGRPAQPEAWQSSPWLNDKELTLIRADYFGSNETVRDAVQSFEDDLLRPLIAELDSPRARSIYRLNELKSLIHPTNFSLDRLAPI